MTCIYMYKNHSNTHICINKQTYTNYNTMISIYNHLTTYILYHKYIFIYICIYMIAILHVHTYMS